MRIGITGGIGSGKSYICDIINRKYGIPIVDSDSVVKDIIMYYESVMNQITKTFGDDSYIDNKINKNKFNNILFNNLNNLTKINNIITPHLIDYFENISSQNKNIILECPILFNTDLYKYVDIKILVTCDMMSKVERLELRYNNDRKLIYNKINSQYFDPCKADYILINDEKLDERIKKLVQKINI